MKRKTERKRNNRERRRRYQRSKAFLLLFSQYKLANTDNVLHFVWRMGVCRWCSGKESVWSILRAFIMIYSVSWPVSSKLCFCALHATSIESRLLIGGVWSVALYSNEFAKTCTLHEKLLKFYSSVANN